MVGNNSSIHWRTSSCKEMHKLLASMHVLLGNNYLFVLFMKSITLSFVLHTWKLSNVQQNCLD